MRDYICKRCGYNAGQLSNLKKHLSRKDPCETLLCSDEREDILLSLPGKIIENRLYVCNICSKEYKDASGLHYHKHKGKCNTNNIKKTERDHELMMLYEDNKKFKEDVYKIINNMRELNTNIEQRVKDTNINKLNIEIQYWKNRRNESFYQMILEELLKGEHKKLKSGITDITNDTLHAEIKNWDSWKYAIGQLSVYNNEDPRDTLQIYFFGKTPNKQTKSIIYTHCKYQNINPYEFIHDNVTGAVKILDEQNNLIHEYLPISAN